MTIKDAMEQQVFAVVGDTLNPEKYAYKIKAQLTEQGYTAYGVGKELASLNDVPEEFDVIDLCINPVRGLQMMKECARTFRYIVIQPGAESDELKAYLDKKGFAYLEGCVLVGLRLYGKGNA